MLILIFVSYSADSDMAVLYECMNKGIPPKFRMFLFGIPLLPERAGIMTNILQLFSDLIVI